VHFKIVLSALACFGLAACDITQTVEPSEVHITITTPDAVVATGTESGSGSPTERTEISLHPASIEISVGENVNVTVIVELVAEDGTRMEIPSENISVSIANDSVIRVVEIDGRTIQFVGLAEGVTSIIIRASDLQDSLVATVSR